MRSLENIKHSRPCARSGLETRLFLGLFSQNLAVRPYLNFQDLKMKICKAEFLLMKKMSNFRFFENY